MIAAPLKLIVGLGNPGPQYESTRHNAGIWLAEAIAQSEKITLKPDRKFQGSHGKFSVAGEECHLFIPSTFMNLSGQAIRALSTFYKISPENMLIAHDDLDLPVGDIRLKHDGGHGGHNGLRDTIQQLGSAKFGRVRIGIGHPGHRDRVHDYVLSRPSVADRKRLDEAIHKILPLIPLLIDGHWQRAMTLLHTKEET